MTRQEQLDLLNKIRNSICGIFDCVADEFDEDSEMYQSIADVEQDLDILAESLAEGEIDTNINYYEYVLGADWDDAAGEVVHKVFTREQSEEMMRMVCKTLAFSDCTDERITKIVYRGCEIEYIGWQPGMVYEFADSNGVVQYSAAFPCWDH